MNRVGSFIKSLPGLVIILGLTTIFGALIFQKIEAPYEKHSRIHVSKTRQKIFLLAQQLARKGDNADWSKLVSQVDRYKEKLHEAWRAGTDELTIENLPTKWSFWSSIYYCFTLFTTIGYGNVFPATSLGKFLTLIYGIIVIPLCSLLISRISTILVRLTKAIYHLTLDPSGVPVGLREAYHRTDGNFDFRVLPCLILFTIYVLLGAVVYSYAFGMKQLNWSILDSIYFAFISITTVGFGDLVPDTDIFLAILSIIYIIVGLAISGIIFGRLTMAFDQCLSRFDSSIITETDAHPDHLTTTTHRSQTSSHLKQS